MLSKNQEQLELFTIYCKMNPDQRFWQALRNWSEYNYIFGSQELDQDTMKPIDLVDTFYK